MAKFLSDAVLAFESMQQEHLAALANGDCGGLASWERHREEAFRDLVRQLEALGKGATVQAEAVLQARNALEKLLVGEKLLTDCLLVRQAKIKEQLVAMHKGKDALQGYSINGGGHGRPRYLSSRT